MLPASTRTRTGRVPRLGWAWGDLAYPVAAAGLMAGAPYVLPYLVDGVGWLATMIGP